MPLLFANNAASTLTADITADLVMVDIETTTAGLFPTPVTADDYFMVTIEDRAKHPTSREICRCIARAGTTLTLIRAQEGTAASAFKAGATVSNRVTAGSLVTLVAAGEAWAEHMPGPIPPDILVGTGLTGDHFSSLYWSNQAADQNAATTATINTFNHLVGEQTALLATSPFDAAASYPVGSLISYNGLVYQALGSVLPGAFNPTQWHALTTMPIPANSIGSLVNNGDGNLDWIPTLPLDGGTMLGLLTLSDDPVTALQAATKRYVQSGPDVMGSNGAGFWTDDATPGVPHRIADRLFLGNARLNDGSSTAGGVGDPTILAGTGVSYYNAIGTLVALSEVGGIGGAFGSITSKYATGDYKAAIGVASYAGADDTSANNISAWAYYGHANRFAGSTAGSVFAMELDVANQGAAVNVNSYLVAPAGVTATAWLGVGGETAQLHGPVNPASMAIGIITSDPNADSLAGTGGVYKRGLVFAHDAISGTDGSTGTGIAISMANGHMIQWDFDLTGARAAGIRSLATAAAGTITFVNTAITFEDTASHTLYNFGTSGAASNGFIWAPGVGTAAPIFSVASTANTNVSLSVNSKGTGLVRLGTGNGVQLQVKDTGALASRSVDIVGAVSGGSPQVTASAGNLLLGNSGLATNATTGMIQIGTCSGTPTGVPSNAGVGATIVFDVLAFKLWAYNTVSNAWKSAQFT